MAKKKPGKDAASSATHKLLEAQKIVELEADERVRLYRKQEAEIAHLKDTLSAVQAKRQQAEKELKEALLQTDALLATTAPNPATWKRLQAKSKDNSATPILCLNDWHSEESVDPATVNGFNNFNLELADARITRTFERAVSLIQHLGPSTPVKDMVVWLGGDLITGYIHEELMESNFLSPTQACLWIEERVIKGLKFLRQELKGLEHIRVVTNHGNHGRSSQRVKFKTGYKNSFEWLSYNQIARRFEDDPFFSFNISRGDHVYETIQDHVVRFHHGDRIKYEGGIGGVTIPVLKAIAQWDKAKRADLDIFGHWHQFLDHWKFVACGCLIGYSDYSLAIKADYQPPTQTLILLNKRLGKTMALPIFCEPAAMYRQASAT